MWIDAENKERCHSCLRADAPIDFFRLNAILFRIDNGESPGGSPEPPGFRVGQRRCNGHCLIRNDQRIWRIPPSNKRRVAKGKKDGAMGPRRVRWLLGMLVAWLVVLSGGMLLALI
jgi:hypothetical protein